MDTEQLSQVVMRVLESYSLLSSPSNPVQPKLLFDTTHHRYQLLKYGWEGSKRFFYVVVYIDVKDNLIWIQDDNTEVGIASLLLKEGVPKDSIVLAFHPPQLRQYTEFNPAV